MEVCRFGVNRVLLRKENERIMRRKVVIELIYLLLFYLTVLEDKTNSDK